LSCHPTLQHAHKARFAASPPKIPRVNGARLPWVQTSASTST
jgi:hypothetical protein